MDSSAKDPVKIQTMFSTIAHRYDLLNRVLSLGIDRSWRRFAVNQLPRGEHARYLDVATGTCDVALEIIRQSPPDSKVIGVDFSEGMLKLGKEKVLSAGLHNRIELRLADVTALPFDDNVFDASIIAFGIRNVQDTKKGISEMGRVVKNIGKVLPFVGEIVSGKKGAYQYLPDSMLNFPPPEKFSRIMEEAGLKDVKYDKLTFGAAIVYVGTVP
jgi:demethylmenaquinone methyltransferase/2-methoxy-6-polyprenyl-1,4-benzoquinol methylase